jgi:cytoskeletal protein CcmA (bactofilin family)
MAGIAAYARAWSCEMRDLSTTDLDWNDQSVASFDTASLVDRHSTFDGNFRSQRDLRVEGELKGNVTCEGTLFVSEGATITATVEAEHVTVAGELTGEIRCRGRLQILPSGRVRANVSTGSLVIQEGAIYEGQLEMAGIDRSTLRPIRARSSIAPVDTDPGQPERQPGNGTTYIRRLGSPEAPWESPEGDADRHSAADEPDMDGPAG